jgi:hypothetical protein
MKHILTIIAALGVAAGVAHAGCGKKETTQGTLEKYDAEAKVITVKPTEGQAVKLTLTPSTKGDIAALVGKKVTVISEHKKVDSVTGS